jgi:LacI family repressor for deo operon, udp, cdd, tsx, nupC, and nupG
MSVVGIDDHEMAQVHDLTTVAQDAKQQGATAARLLLRALQAPSPHPSDDDIVVPSWLVLRGSTAPPPQRRTPTAHNRRGR